MHMRVCVHLVLTFALCRADREGKGRAEPCGFMETYSFLLAWLQSNTFRDTAS